MEQIQRFARGELPYGPIWYLTGLEMVDAEEGAATFRMPVTERLYSPAGVIPGGVLAFAADGPIATAILTTLGPRKVLASSDLTVNFVRPAAPDADSVLVHARLVHAGRAQALGQATVEDPTGELLAYVTSRCVVIDVPGPLPDPPDRLVPPLSYSGPPPFQRPAEGSVLPQQMWDRMDGIDILRGWQRGEVPRSPLSNLLGATVVDVGEGKLACAMPASPWFANLGGTLYGGALALLADYAVHGAVQSTAPAGTSWATLDLQVRYLRPVQPDGQLLTAQASVVHRGRRLVVVGVEITTVQGKRAVLADASVMLTPGRPWRQAAIPIDEAQNLS